MNETEKHGKKDIKSRDWETEIRDAFKEALLSDDQVVESLAKEVLEIEKLNEFCFVISPKIIKHLLESNDPILKDVVYRLWSSQVEGHVCVIAIDKSRKKVFVVEAAGLLNKDKKKNDSSLGIHELDADGAYRLFGNPDREQFISPEYSDSDNFSIDPKTEDEMNSQKLNNLSNLV